MEKYDIAIIGAGPAGTSAAINLGSSGLKIAIIDACNFPRHKVCGDALSGSVMQTLRKFPGNIADDFLKFEKKLKSTGVRFFSPDNNMLDLQLQLSGNDAIDNPGYLSKREDFDNFLFDHIKDYPDISIIQNFKVDNIIKSTDKITICSEGREIHSKLIIGADGSNSTVAKYLTNNKIDRNHSSSCIMTYFENVSGFHEDNFIELHFLKELLPGYLWIFPMRNNIANVGLGTLSSTLKKKQINLKKIFNEVISNHPTISPRFKDSIRTSSIRGGAIPLGSDNRQIYGERFMLCGDAAGLVNPFTSEGISYAMRSGMLAAEQIKKCFENNDFSEQYMKQYDAEIRKKFNSEFSINHRIQKLSKRAWLFNFVVRKVNRNPELKQLFISMFNNMDVRKLLTRPSFYLKLLIK